MRVLITGGAGFIGSHLAERLVKEGHTVRILDNLSSGSEKNISTIQKQVQFIQGDILDQSLINSAMKNIDTVFHLAAKITVHNSFANEKSYEAINIHGTKNIITAVIKNDVKKLIFASSAAVYGNVNQLPICEDTKTEPISPLGKTKLAGEAMCLAAASNRLQITILRFFNAYGPRQNLELGNVICMFINNLKNNLPCTLYGTGEQTRDFVFIDDIIQACMKDLDLSSRNVSIYNIGSGKPTKIIDLYEMIRNELRTKQLLQFQPLQQGDILQSYACIHQAENILRFKPLVNITEGLRATVQRTPIVAKIS
jgi:nucleoside-diphosphate-sugar epimerase